MDQAIEQGRRHPLMAEDLRPVRDVEVRGEAHAGPVVAVGEKREEHLRRQMGKGERAHLVDQDEVAAAELRQARSRGRRTSCWANSSSLASVAAVRKSTR